MRAPHTHLQDEGLVYVAFGCVGLEVGRLEEAEEELVHELQHTEHVINRKLNAPEVSNRKCETGRAPDLEVRPGGLERRLVLLRVELGSVRVRRRRQRPEQVDLELPREKRKHIR